MILVSGEQESTTSCSTNLDHLLHQHKPLRSVYNRVRNLALARLYVLVAMRTLEQILLT